ncbi:hypothetical protein GEV33_005800 [Tenebrio molitor]|uniref:Uncharacterized protein n=1 Tax=Tenebrio molitor TaxID=7067 RepID=A0A8J6HL01_TENMO|nr:hypothetical protein GEV33_005800 [Tenebrio molitor]
MFCEDEVLEATACAVVLHEIPRSSHRDKNVHGLPPKNLRIEGAEAINRGNEGKTRKFTAVRSVVSAWGSQGDSDPVGVVGEDSSKYHRPKWPSGSRTSLRKVSGPNALRIKISSGPARPGRPRTHRKVPGLPYS